MSLIENNVLEAAEIPDAAINLNRIASTGRHARLHLHWVLCNLSAVPLSRPPPDFNSSITHEQGVKLRYLK